MFASPCICLSCALLMVYGRVCGSFVIVYIVAAEFVKQPIACLTLASFLATNTGDVARKHINDPELLSFIDIECYCWSTVLAGLTPMMNAGMVFCDRHYGGINYPKGGVGRIAQALAGVQ